MRRRASAKLIKMIEQGRPCPEIVSQLKAVEGAIENAKKGR
jgi:DNA-binding FrmR family transcriptional regulator